MGKEIFNHFVIKHMNVVQKAYKIFWPVFIIIFVAVTIVVGKIIFDSFYPAISSGYKPTLILPKFSGEPNKISDAERYGYIISDEIWSGEIRVTGDIIVPKGVTLTIKPGTTVLVDANSDKENLMTLSFWKKDGLYLGEGRDQYIHQGEPYRNEPNHITIWVAGTLYAVATDDEKIVIKSNSQNPGRYDWNTLHIENGIISYAEIRDYRAMDLGTGSKLTNSELHNVGECPICISDSENILIDSNWVHDSGHEIVDNTRSSPTIINNHFGPSPQFLNLGGHTAGWGGLIVGSGFPTIKGNVIEGFNDAVSFFDKASYDVLADGVIKNNTFKDNIENVVLNLNPD